MKNKRLSSKRKWIVGGAMFFAGIGLLTTGFATWIIGTQVLKQNDNLGITVDTATNGACTMKATLTPDEAFYLGETGVVKGEDKLVSTEGGKAAEFDVTFTEVIIKAGVDSFNEHFAKNTPFTLKLTSKPDGAVGEKEVNVTAKNTIDGTANKIGANRVGDTFTYIDLSAKSQIFTPGTGIPEWDVSKSIKSIKLSNVTFTFGWGTFFNKQSPSAFYNSKYSEIHNDLDMIAGISEELNAMKEAFKVTDGNKAVLPFELELVPGTVSAE